MDVAQTSAREAQRVCGVLTDVKWEVGGGRRRRRGPGPLEADGSAATSDIPLQGGRGACARRQMRRLPQRGTAAARHPCGLLLSFGDRVPKKYTRNSEGET